MSHYDRGTQDISAHQATYASITRLTLWSGALIGFATLYLSLVFAGGMSWMTSLFIVYALSIGIGIFLRRGGAWFATMTGLAVITALIGFAASMISSAM